MPTQSRDQMSPYEYEKYNQEKELFELQSQHDLDKKRLEIEQLKLEAKWASWIKIPLWIIMLPVRFIMAFAVIVAAIRKAQLGDRFWDFMG